MTKPFTLGDAGMKDIEDRQGGVSQPNEKNVSLESAGFESDEIGCLHISRHIMVTFADPKGQNWQRAFLAAEDMFGAENGGFIASAVMQWIDAVRLARRSPFTFSNPFCANCSKVVSEHERRLITALQHVRAGHRERAIVELMMLCEGNDTAEVLLLTEMTAKRLEQSRTVVSNTNDTGEISHAEETIH